ncbi:MAG: ACP phosphodiesterase [Fimbriiglobus sp.]|nr:ACP phosphodiesterase [Fimbriiglobus sp.]
MNHLAHLLLAEPTPESRLGNLAADYVWHREIASLTNGIRRGIQQHQQIDAFTDRHPAVGRCLARMSDRWGWFGGIILDVYFDYLLATSWADWCPVPLEQWAFEVNADLRATAHLLPEEACGSVQRIATTNRLMTYRELEGIEAALVRLTHILRQRIPQRAVDLTEAMPDLAEHHEALRGEFAVFFPELMAFSAQWVAGGA